MTLPLQRNKILLIVKSSSIKGKMQAIFKQLGFNKVDVVQTVDAGIHLLEVESFDWVFSEFCLHEKTNIFHLLSIIRDEASLSKLKISLIFGSEDFDYLGKAMEFGALSFHEASLSQEEAAKDIQNLLSMIEEKCEDSRLISASYIRGYLKKSQHFKDLLEFEKSLLTEYAGNTDLLFSLAQAQLLNLEVTNAKKSLRQLCIIDSSLQSKADELIAPYLSPDESKDKGQNNAPINLLDVQYAVVIEPQIEQAKRINKLLKSLGVTKVKMFKSPFSAYNFIVKRKHVDLIISEWSLPEFPAPILFQRIFDNVEDEIPIIVYNEDLTEEDIPQLEEMGVHAALVSPFEDNDLLKQVLVVFQEMQNEFSVPNMKKKVRKALTRNNFKKAELLFKELTLMKESSSSDLKIIEAEWAYAKRKFEDSKKKALDAMKDGANTLEALTILGRSLISLRNFDAGLKCLESASVMSPFHVGRLCGIAEAHLENGETKKFEHSLNQAKRINPHNPAVKELEIAGAIRQKQTKKAKELMAKLPDLSNVIRYNNNKAIALIQCDRYDEGIRTYREAIEALPDKKTELRSVVQYNLGLAYARAEDLDSAIASLKQATKSVNKIRNKKAAALLKKFKIAKERNIQPKIPPLRAADDGDIDEHLKAIEVTDEVFDISPVKNLGCYKLFLHNESKVDLEALLEGKPKFNIRQAIKKEYARGLERTLRSA